MDRIKVHASTDPCAAAVEAALVSSGYTQSFMLSEARLAKCTARPPSWEEAFEITRNVMKACNVTTPSARLVSVLMSRGCRGSLWAASLLFFTQRGVATTSQLTAQAINAALEARSLTVANQFYDHFTDSRPPGCVPHAQLGPELTQARSKMLAKMHQWRQSLQLAALNSTSLTSTALGYVLESCGRSKSAIPAALGAFQQFKTLVDARVVDSLLSYVTTSSWEHNLDIMAMARSSHPDGMNRSTFAASTAFSIAMFRTVGNAPTSRGWHRALQQFVSLSNEDRVVVAPSFLRLLDRLDTWMRRQGAQHSSNLLAVSLAYRDSLMLPNFSTLLLRKELQYLLQLPRQDPADIRLRVAVVDTNVVLSALMSERWRESLTNALKTFDLVIIPLPVIREVTRHLRVGLSSVVMRSLRKEHLADHPNPKLCDSRRRLWTALEHLLTQRGTVKWRIASPLQHYRAIAGVSLPSTLSQENSSSDAMDSQILRFAIAVQKELAASAASVAEVTESSVYLATRDAAFIARIGSMPPLRLLSLSTKP